MTDRGESRDLRGTGKTVGLLSVLHGRDAVYFCAGEFENTGVDEWRRMLGECKERVICIDEYSWIPDRDKLDGFLYQLVQDGKRVLITGTVLQGPVDLGYGTDRPTTAGGSRFWEDRNGSAEAGRRESFTIDMLNHGGLIHRVLTEHVTWFSYPEYCRVFGLSGELKKGYIETHDADNLEIDFYAADKYCAYLFECKSKEKPSLDVNASIRKDACPLGYIPFFPDAEEVYRFVIYNGETCMREMDGNEIRFLPAQRMDLLFRGDLENIIDLEEREE